MKQPGRRRILQRGLAFVGLGLLAACWAAPIPGQRSAGPRRVGFLDAGPSGGTIRPFREGLGALGYVEGQTILIEYRDAGLNPERLPSLVAELIGAPVEILVVSNAPTALAASQATRSVPIVAAGGNIVAAGLVSNLAHPEGNITGVTTNSVEVIGKWVELLKETVPTISHLAALVDLSNSSPAQAFLRELQRADQSLQLQHTTYDLRELDQLPTVLAAARADGVDGLLVVSGGVLRGGTDPRIAVEAMRSRLPAVAETRPFTVNGGLLAHGPNTDELARRSATYVDKILKGAKPADLPIELPAAFDIVVNLKTAQELGITLPRSVLQRATETIQ